MFNVQETFEEIELQYTRCLKERDSINALFKKTPEEIINFVDSKNITPEFILEIRDSMDLLHNKMSDIIQDKNTLYTIDQIRILEKQMKDLDTAIEDLEEDHDIVIDIIKFIVAFQDKEHNINCKHINNNRGNSSIAYSIIQDKADSTIYLLSTANVKLSKELRRIQKSWFFKQAKAHQLLKGSLFIDQFNSKRIGDNIKYIDYCLSKSKVANAVFEKEIEEIRDLLCARKKLISMLEDIGKKKIKVHNTNNIKKDINCLSKEAGIIFQKEKKQIQNFLCGRKTFISTLKDTAKKKDKLHNINNIKNVSFFDKFNCFRMMSK